MTCIWVTNDLHFAKAKALIVVNLLTEFSTAGRFLHVEEYVPGFPIPLLSSSLVPLLPNLSWLWGQQDSLRPFSLTKNSLPK